MSDRIWPEATPTVDMALAVAAQKSPPHIVILWENEDESMTLINSEMTQAELVWLLEKAKLCHLQGERIGRVEG